VLLLIQQLLLSQAQRISANAATFSVVALLYLVGNQKLRVQPDLTDNFIA